MTASELLFEKYLRENGWPEFRHEAPQPNTNKLPDYEVRLDGEPAFFEVKEWEAQPPPKGFTTFDPYAPIREKINAAQKQLHPHKGSMCCVVLSNPNEAFVELDDMTVFGAMLGNVGFEIPFDHATGTLDDTRARQAFLDGGKMIRYAKPTAEVPRQVPIAAQNTTISAVVVVSMFPLGHRRFDAQHARHQRELGRNVSLEELWAALIAAKGTEADPSLRQLRVQVFENPYAARSLHERFGSGPWDERFGEREGRLIRVTCGERLRRLEEDERDAGVEIDDTLGLRRP